MKAGDVVEIRWECGQRDCKSEGKFVGFRWECGEMKIVLLTEKEGEAPARSTFDFDEITMMHVKGKGKFHVEME